MTLAFDLVHRLALALGLAAAPQPSATIADVPQTPVVAVADAPRPAPAPKVVTLLAAAEKAPAKEASAAAPAPAKTPAAKKGTGSQASARALVDKVQSFYEHTKDFTARFEQTYKSKAFGRTMKSSGTVAFKKPAMMRWDYTSPRDKSFIVDGKDLWIWTPEDDEAIRSKGFTTDSLSASITFLWGKGRLADEFDIVKRGESELVLTPKRPQGGYDQVIFDVDPKTGRVLKTTVLDSQGNENVIAFEDVKLNVGLSDDRFHFTPPKGAEVKELSETGLH